MGIELWLGLKSLSREFVSLRGLKCREQRWGGVGVSFLCLREACCGGAMPHIKDKSGVNGFLVVLRETEPGDQKNCHRSEQVLFSRLRVDLL